MVESILLMGIGVALAGALAFIAGLFEDAESEAGSASNPNSQVQLAPQIGHNHRYFNKAISGEPPANALWATIAATIAVLLYPKFGGDIYAVLIASVAGALVSAVMLSLYGMFAHISRTASMFPFKQVFYVDALLVPLPLDFAFGFLTALLITLMAFTLHFLIGNPFSVPLLALFFGITIGSIGSATGDIHYGAERLYQHYIFGSGIPISTQGDIDVKGEYGYRNSVDSTYFCMRFGGPITGITIGLLIFLDGWSRMFNFAGVWTSNIIEAVLIVLILIITIWFEKYIRDKYGIYEEAS